MSCSLIQQSALLFSKVQPAPIFPHQSYPSLPFWGPATHFSCQGHPLSAKFCSHPLFMPLPNHSLRRTRGIVRLIASLLSHNENIGKWKLLLPLQIVTRVKSNLYLAFPGSSVAEYILPFSRIQIISWREVSTEGKLLEFQRTILTRSGHFAACQQICHMPEENPAMYSFPATNKTTPCVTIILMRQVRKMLHFLWQWQLAELCECFKKSVDVRCVGKENGVYLG